MSPYAHQLYARSQNVSEIRHHSALENSRALLTVTTMADIEIIRERGDGFTHQGHSVSYTDSYIKLRRSFKQHLKRLRGVQLHVFLFISLSETPPDVKTLCAELEYHSESICNALDILVARRFIEEMPRVGSNGIKCYRHISFAWDGPDRSAPADVRISESEIRQPRGKPKFDTRKIRDGDAEKRNSTRRKAKSDAENSRVPHDMNDDSYLKQERDSSIHDNPATQKILAENGVQGKNLDLLARSVAPTTAQAWADWLTVVDRERWTQPVGYLVKKLLANPNARPPFVPIQTPETARRAGPVISGRLAELALQYALPEATDADEPTP